MPYLLGTGNALLAFAKRELHLLENHPFSEHPASIDLESTRAVLFG